MTTTIRFKNNNARDNNTRYKKISRGFRAIHDRIAEFWRHSLTFGKREKQTKFKIKEVLGWWWWWGVKKKLIQNGTRKQKY
jgi:hypothetical protein